MNTLKIYPEKLRKSYERNIFNSGIKMSPEKYHNSLFKVILFLTAASFALFYFLNMNLVYSLLVFALLEIFFYYKINLSANARIKTIENVFPDFISLMASNLRSGITIDRAFLLSARPEFFPLDQEIFKTGKDIATGRDIIDAFKIMGERIDSEKIGKVITLITSGLKAGGNISDLLEETSRNMKEKEIIEKKAASTILMYVIFIFFAVSVGAPVLFGLGSVLVEIVINLASKMPELSSTQMNLPFTFNKISISVDFIIYFSVMFMILTDLISCFVIGLVNKGEGKEGLKLFIPLLILSLGLFFLVRSVLSKILLSAISSF